jgi:hypothetical protein
MLANTAMEQVGELIAHLGLKEKMKEKMKKFPKKGLTS